MPNSIKKVSDGQLCTWCQNINLGDLISDEGYEHQPKFAALHRSSLSCDLCHLIVRAVDKTVRACKYHSNELDDEFGPVKLVSQQPSRQDSIDQPGNVAAGRHQEIGKISIIIGRNVTRKLAFSIAGAQLDMFTVKGIYALAGYKMNLLFDAVADHPLPLGSNAERLGVPCANLVDAYALTQRNVYVLKELLQSCHAHHYDCSHDISQKLLARHHERFGSFGGPRRLLDVTMSETSKVRVIEVTCCPRYAALTYCWGSHPQLCATQQNMAQMQKGVSISSLCLAIQDAISITRYLDIPYLWVDALCILQTKDNASQWASELETMGLIYAQAYVTLAAAATDDCGKSFTVIKRKSDYIASSSCNNPLSTDKDLLLFRLPIFDFAEAFEGDVYGSALSRRAWAMQERILSSRTIHFTATQIYWECRSLFWAENGDTCIPLGYEGFQRSSSFIDALRLLETKILRSEDRSTTDNAVCLFLRSWTEIVAHYSRLKLTHPGDRLSAIAGVACLASLLMPGDYLSGIWGCDLSNGLFWTPREHTMHVPVVRSAPSWSWASTSSSVELCCRRISTSDNSLIALRDVNKDADGLEVLVIEGQLYECIVSESAEPYHKPRRAKDDTGANPNIPRYKFRLKPGFQSECEQGVCLFDDIRGSDTKFFFLPLGCPVQFRGLILNNNDSEQDIYRRCGVGWYMDRLPSMAYRQFITLA